MRGERRVNLTGVKKTITCQGKCGPQHYLIKREDVQGSNCLNLVKKCHSDKKVALQGDAHTAFDAIQKD